jgi:hypothetical protein
MELTMDPCERSVCREAVGWHIELVGRAIGQPTLSQPGYRLLFRTVTLRASTRLHDDELAVYTVPIADAIAASRRPHGGLAWLDERSRAERDWEPDLTRAIARRAAERRVELAAAPTVRKAGASAEVALRVRGDRNRLTEQVLAALAAVGAGLRDSPGAPKDARIEVEAEVPMHGVQARRFRCTAAPLALMLEGKLGAREVWSSYVEEVKHDAHATRLDFGTGTVGGPEPDDNDALEILAANFGGLGACARAESQRSHGFRGVTVAFRWMPTGKAAEVAPAEPALRVGPLADCLRAAMDAIRLPRFSGAPRPIEYPIRIQ